MLFVILNTCYLLILSSVGYKIQPHEFLIIIQVICSLILLYLLYEFYKLIKKKEERIWRKQLNIQVQIAFYIMLAVFQTEINYYLYHQILVTNFIQILIQIIKIATQFVPQSHQLSLNFEEIQNLEIKNQKNCIRNKQLIIIITTLYMSLLFYQCLRSLMIQPQFSLLFLISVLYYIMAISYELYLYLLHQLKQRQKAQEIKKTFTLNKPQNSGLQIDEQLFSENDNQLVQFDRIKEIQNIKILNFMQEGVIIFEKQNESLGIEFTNYFVFKLFGVNDQSELIEMFKQQKEWEQMQFDYDCKSIKQLKLSSSLSSQKSFGFIWNYLQQSQEQETNNLNFNKPQKCSLPFIIDKNKSFTQKSLFLEKKLKSSLLIKLTENKTEAFQQKISGTINMEGNSTKQLKPDLFTYLNSECKKRKFADLNQLNEKCDYTIVTFSFINKENQYLSIEMSIFTIFYNKKAHMLLLLRDITHRKYISKLQSNNKQKSKTISFVSHEFRTPLNCIITMLEQFEEDFEVKQNDIYIRSSINNAKYLLNLSNDLLDLAQIKAGKFTLNYSRFNFQELIEECLQMFRLQAEKKKIELRLIYPSHIPVIINSDQNRIRQIIVNLLSNAFKFTTEGQIKIKVSVDYSNRRDLLVEVEDTGLGIRKEDQKILFTAFGKINSEESKKINSQGVGLGLVISNIIAQQLNLSSSNGLKFQSEFRKGTTFSFIITQECTSLQFNENNYQIEELESELLSYMSAQTPLSKKILELEQIAIRMIGPIEKERIKKQNNIGQSCKDILIVDDNSFNIEALQILLKKCNIYHVDSTISGILAEDKIREKLNHQCLKCQKKHHGYRLIFMDVEMPCQDGKVTTLNIRSMYEFNKCEQEELIIIGCSAYESEYEKEECLNYGMNDYLPKPVKLKDLMKMLQIYYQ